MSSSQLKTRRVRSATGRRLCPGFLAIGGLPVTVSWPSVDATVAADLRTPVKEPKTVSKLADLVNISTCTCL